nr:hypothetical protein [Tanacetum cinerariifolium]
MNKKNTSLGICVFTNSDDTMNDDTPIGVASTVQEGVTPSMVDITVETEKQNYLEDTTILGSFPSLSTPGTTTTDNAYGKSLYANITGKPSGKKMNVRTLFTLRGNGIDVVVLVDSIHAISERFINTAYGFSWERMWHTLLLLTMLGILENNPLILKKWLPNENLFKKDVSTVTVWVKLHGVPVTAFSEDGLSAIATKLGTPLMLDSYTSDMCIQSWGRSSYARVMIELRVDVNLKDNIVMAMPKITKEGHYTCNVRVEYEWKPSRCSSCKVFRHIHEEYLKNTGAGEKKTVKKPSQTSRGVPVGKLRLLDNDGNPLVPTGIVESDSEVEVVFYETANLRISTSGKDGSDKCYDTNSLLEQWRDYYLDNDDFDPYDDDMYENHDLSEHLQSICDDLAITARFITPTLLELSIIVCGGHSMVPSTYPKSLCPRRWPPRVTLGRLLPHARGLEFKPRRGGFPSGAKKEWGLSPKAKVRVLHTAQLDVTGVDAILRDGPWMIREFLFFLISGHPHARALIEINACNEFRYNLVMAIPKLEDSGYMKETIRTEYEWKPPHWGTCLIYDHALEECPKDAPKPVVMEWIKVSLKLKFAYRHKVVQLAQGPSVSPNTTKHVDTNAASTSGCNKDNTMSSSKKVKVNCTPTLVATSSGSLSTTPLVTRINKLESQMLDGKLVPVGDDERPLKLCKFRFISPNPFDLLSKFDDSNEDGKDGGKNILHDLQKSDDDAELDNV